LLTGDEIALRRAIGAAETEYHWFLSTCKINTGKFPIIQLFYRSFVFFENLLKRGAALARVITRVNKQVFFSDY
jgi:hypothetical protein